MTIQKKIKDRLTETAANHRVKDVRIGLGYTAVVLDNGTAGMAYTPHRQMRPGCSAFPGLMPVENPPASDLLKLLVSDHFIETAVGLATANALAAEFQDPACTRGDVLEIAGLKSDDVVGMVGHFAPIEGLIRKTAKTLVIFELIDQPSGEILPSAEISRRLPDCTVAIITATTLINHTFETVMAHAGNCREVILLGASTPMLADVFSATPVTCLSGVQVTNVDEILRIVSFGGGTRMFRKCVRKLNLKI